MSAISNGTLVEAEPRTGDSAGASVTVEGLRHAFGELEVIRTLDLAAAPGEVQP